MSWMLGSMSVSVYLYGGGYYYVLVYLDDCLCMCGVCVCMGVCLGVEKVELGLRDDVGRGILKRRLKVGWMKVEGWEKQCEESLERWWLPSGALGVCEWRGGEGRGGEGGGCMVVWRGY